ncbi:hypothetical protein SAMN04515671_2300 [Nakamurella panacisegetis]|uniref:Lipoprotein n=1 Tax=Nakamurella panacisegetis TaxID=1090615 RepID=A0A1H0NBT7_9ACTN|nr:hypothetical protein [Nakamurella panacisegetis]SDO90121.1 hypothetical protein SAMN04515671_2300 [Nakamurella panacisegetis]
MKRTSWLAAILGAGLLLAGCSSTGGTATANTSSASSAAASSAAAPSSGAAPSSSAEAPSSAPASSAAASSGAPASGSAETSGSSSASEATTAPTTTVGDNSSSLDAQTSAWFSAFCTGFTPVVDLTSDPSSLASSATDLAKAQKALVDFYSKLGSAFTDTADKLKGLPAPTFNGGPEFASKVVIALTKAGPAFTTEAKKLAAIDVSKDPSALSSALTGLSGSMTTALQPLQDLSSLKLTPQTLAGFEAIPACAALKAKTGN